MEAPFAAKSRFDDSSSLTTFDGGATKGYVEIPQAEH